MSLHGAHAGSDRETYLDSLGWAERHNEEVFATCEIRELIGRTGDWLEALIGPRRGAAAMQAVLLALGSGSETADAAAQRRRAEIASHIEAKGWREALDDEADSFVDWPSEAADFEWLYAYAVDGVVHEGMEARPVEERRAQLEERFARADRFIALMPPNWEPSAGYRWSLRGIHAAAKARWKLDTASRLTSAEVARLGRLDEKTVLNALSDGRLPSTADGTCSAEDARIWLLARRPKKFRPSRWTDPADDQDSRSPPRGDDADARAPDLVWVPIDARGEAFLPTLARPTRQGGVGFRIGPKGREWTVGDYFEALTALRAMHPPRWRRPNAEGHWGIVRAEPNWRPIPRAEVERLLREAGT